MPAIKGAREELERLKLALAEIEASGEPASAEIAERRTQLEQQMLRLERAIHKYDGDGG